MPVRLMWGMADFMLQWQSGAACRRSQACRASLLTVCPFTVSLGTPALGKSRFRQISFSVCFLTNQVSNSAYVFLERQRCALWIRKLCEPSGTGAGVMGRKNRNLYAKLLLHMLKRGVIEGPFIQRPEPGTLKTLPSYMVGVVDQKVY